MRNLWAILRKELYSYFTSPVAYVVIILFILLLGFFFVYFLSVYDYKYNQYQAQLNYYFQMSAQYPMIVQQMPQPQPPNFNQTVTQSFYFWFGFMMLFMLPMLTMRLFSEEKRSGTMELLLTYPVGDFQIIVGKYLATMAVFSLILILTMIFPLFINMHTEKAPLEFAPLALAYLGLWLVGSAFIAIGMFVSSLTKNQIIAAVMTFGVLFGFFFLWLLGYNDVFLSQYIGLFGVTEFVEFFRHLSIFNHHQNFIAGILDTRDLVYCTNLTLVSLLLCWFSLGTRKWRV